MTRAVSTRGRNPLLRPPGTHPTIPGHRRSDEVCPRPPPSIEGPLDRNEPTRPGPSRSTSCAGTGRQPFWSRPSLPEGWGFQSRLVPSRR
jgi:hypothetical protein